MCLCPRWTAAWERFADIFCMLWQLLWILSTNLSDKPYLDPCPRPTNGFTHQHIKGTNFCCCLSLKTISAQINAISINTNQVRISTKTRSKIKKREDNNKIHLGRRKWKKSKSQKHKWWWWVLRSVSLRICWPHQKSIKLLAVCSLDHLVWLRRILGPRDSTNDNWSINSLITHLIYVMSM